MVKTQYQLTDNKYQDLVLNIDQYFAQSTTVIYQGRNQLKEVAFLGEIFIVKLYKKPSALNQFIYGFIRNSKAKKSYFYAQKISKWTPLALAYTQNYYYGLLRKSYLICQKSDNQFDMLAILTDKEADISDNNRQNLITQFVDWTYELHENGICHLDYWNGNILVKKINNHYQFNLVDINRMRFGKLSAKLRAKSFQRMVVSDKNLKNMSKQYANLANFDEDKFYTMVVNYRQKLQKFKARKYKIKSWLNI